jgi:aminoglycoside phosphotransferase family enzyme/predicted kinase
LTCIKPFAIGRTPEPDAMTNKPPSETPAAVGEDAVVAFLRTASSFDEPVHEVEVIETHCARVFLAGTKAYKVKKPVRLPFLDFSTLELRHQALTREMELNAPHAPEIYLRLVALTRRDGGGLAIGGDGPAVEWALEMRRFDQASLLSAIASKGPLPRITCTRLADMVARYHEQAPAAHAADGARIVQETLLQLLSELEAETEILGADVPGALRRSAEGALARIAVLLESRAVAGAVRRCHGDLHLGNIVMIGERPVPFDALEFDEALATIDVLYDLAFLLMDLEVRGDRTAASVVFNAYVGAAPLRNEIEGLACLPLFLAMRALVRAVVALARAHQQQHDKRRHTEMDARRLAEAALAFLSPPPASLLAVGGFSGTGKSTLAAALAPRIGPAPGALHLRSDVERKRLFNVAEAERLTPDHYRPEVSVEVYRLLLNKAERALAAGHSVVVDAVFMKLEERLDLEAVATRTGAGFAGLWLEAPADTLIARVEARRGDASDADAAVVQSQLARPTGAMSWTRVDARGDREATLAAAAAKLSPAILRHS